MGKLFDLGNNDKNHTDKKITIREEVAEPKDIAIIGIASMLPLADTPDKFWDNLVNEVDCVRAIPEARRSDIDKLMKYIGQKNIEYSEIAYLDEIDKFDYAFFGLSPKEASLMDPHQRLFLETAWKCIEDAGYGGDKLIGSRTGVYLGYSCDTNYKTLIKEVQPESAAIALTGNIPSIIASRLSYILDLKGPSVNVDTACSSSMVAIHYACESIRRGECSAAIAGSVKLQLLPMKNTNDIGITSSDGRTKTFDDSSDGTGAGEGVIAFLLKPLQKAVEARDNIYAIIKGSAANQDGASVGISAPNPAAQADVITKAWENAQVDPMTISYIEAHGTGTKLGDPIEVEGIRRAFERYTTKKNFCAIGSVKSNIGHLDHAAGAAGLLKCVQALANKKLPPLLHFNVPNKNIDFLNSPIYINKGLKDWDTNGSIRRCGISSFGISGTNCHMILEEYVESANESVEDNEADILTLSAKSEESLMQIVKNYIHFFEAHRNINIHEACYTANTGRGHYKLRIAIIFSNKQELIEKLKCIEKEGFIGKTQENIYFGTSKVQNENNINDLGSEYLNAYSKNLHKLCEVYVSGEKLDWEELYNSQNRNRISIPTYPFARSRCWIEVPERSEAITPIESKEIYGEINKNKRINVSDEEASKIILTGNENNQYSKYEKLIAEIWGSELGLNKINIFDTYEDLGGNSIMAIKMETEFEKINLPITVEEIFEFNSINSLAIFISKQLGEDNDSADMPIFNRNESKVRDEAPVTDESILIDKIMPFNELFFKGCFYNALFPAIRHFGKNIELFLANDIIVYDYKNINNNEENKFHFSVKYIEKEGKAELLNQLGILCTRHNRSLNLVKDLENAINIKHPAIVWIDCYYESFRVDAYNKQHIAHTLLVYGYSREKQQFHVLEQINRNSLTYQPILISYKEMVECYEGYMNNFYKGEDTLHELYPNTDKNNNEIADNQSLESIKRSFADYLRDNLNTIFTSLSNIDYFESYYMELIKDKNSLQKNAQDLCVGLNAIIDAKRVESYRISKLFDDSDAITVLIGKIIQELEIMRKIINIFAFTGKYKIDSLSNTLKNIENIKKLEYEYYNALVVYLDNQNSSSIQV